MSWLDELVNQMSLNDAPSDAVPSDPATSSDFVPSKDSSGASKFFEAFFGGAQPDTSSMGNSADSGPAYGSAAQDSQRANADLGLGVDSRMPSVAGFDSSSASTPTFFDGVMNKIGLKHTSDGSIDWSDPTTVTKALQLIMAGGNIMGAIANRGQPQGYKTAAQLKQEIAGPLNNWTPQQQASADAFFSKPLQGPNHKLAFAADMPNPITAGRGYADGGAVGDVTNPAYGTNPWATPNGTQAGADFLAYRASQEPTFTMGADGKPVWSMPSALSLSMGATPPSWYNGGEFGAANAAAASPAAPAVNSPVSSTPSAPPPGVGALGASMQDSDPMQPRGMGMGRSYMPRYFGVGGADPVGMPMGPIRGPRLGGGPGGPGPGMKAPNPMAMGSSPTPMGSFGALNTPTMQPTTSVAAMSPASTTPRYFGVGGGAGGMNQPGQVAMRRGGPVFGYSHGGGALGHVMASSGGQDDVVPARLAGGEYVFDADSVSALGDGNNAAGAKKLDKARENLRRHKRSAPPDKIPPRAKPIEQYMKGGK